ncbi:MAG TPA: hypothetical protein G4O15_06085 [Dehalococcoidia bacterium]|nr:hypothetical protein [Dehalococcoidia bacterium]
MLELTRETREKLRRYLINADPFLWGVLDSKNKKGRIQELKSMGYLTHYPEKFNYNYSKINQDLLVEVGVEGILENIIIPKVRALFTPEVLEYFRRCWEQGQTPHVKYLREQGLYKRRIGEREIYEDSFRYEQPSGYKDPPFIFLQIHSQQNFVERWTVFGGLWFEDIEPLL